MNQMAKSPHYIRFRNFKLGKRIFKLRFERKRHSHNCEEHGFLFDFAFAFTLRIEKEAEQLSTIQ